MLTLWILSIIVTLYIADQKKLGVVGYFFVSLFIGPLAVLIVLLMPSREIQSGTGLCGGNTLEDAKKQLEGLRHSLHVQEEKIKNLEILIYKLSGTSADVSAQKEVTSEPLVVTPVPVTAVEDQEPPMSAERSDMELDFGRNWLSKIGIAVLALGMAFFISYAFKYFGPFLKIALGYSVAGALFFAGVKLETKDRLMHYGRALLGGAWAMTYFTTYAMYHFEASRVIDNQGVDLFLVALVVLGMMAHTLRYKSEEMMAVALVVAYVTSTIGQITAFTVVSNLFLAVLILFFAYRFQWIRTLSLGIMMTYGIHFIWVAPNIVSSAPETTFLGISTPHYHDFMNLIFLTSYWLVFFVGVHLARPAPDTVPARTLASINFGNIALYSVLSYPLVLKLFYGQRCAIVFVEGLIYLASALVMKRWIQEKMYISDIVAAVFAITFSISLKFFPTSALLLWLIEVPFLLFIGANFKEKIFNYLSYALAAFVAGRLLFLGSFEIMPDIRFLGFDWTWHGFMCFWAGVSMAGCFYLTQRFKKGSVAGDIDLLFDQAFSLAACLYVSFWIGSWVHQPWVAFSLSMQGWFFFVIGVLLGLRRFRAYAYLAFGSSAVIFLCEPIRVSMEILKWFIVGFDVLSVLGVYHAVRYLQHHRLSDLFFEHEEEVTFVVGILLLVGGICQYAALPWISLSLGTASVLLILIGFAGGNKTERMGGMALLALTLARVVFVDLSGLDILFKIITLIVLGVLFLGVSYVYNRFGVPARSTKERREE